MAYTINNRPPEDWSGIDTFSYTISSETGSDTANVTITIVPQEPPLALNDEETTEVNIPVDVRVLLNDSDPEDDTLTVVETTECTMGGSVTVTATGGAESTIKYR